MSERPQPKFRLSRRSLLQAASLVPVGASTLPDGSSVAGLCLAWLRSEVRLDALTLALSKAEAAASAAGMLTGPREAATKHALNEEFTVWTI